MPSTVVRAVTVVAVAVAVAACSGGGKDSAAPAATRSGPTGPSATAGVTSSATPAAGDRAAVEKVFADYNAALLARNFTTACALTSPDAAEALVKALTSQGARVTTCEQAFAAVYAAPQACGQLDDAARSLEIDDVRFVGDTATVTYHGTANGQTRGGLVNKLRRIDGKWRLGGNGA